MEVGGAASATDDAGGDSEGDEGIDAEGTEGLNDIDGAFDVGTDPPRSQLKNPGLLEEG